MRSIGRRTGFAIGAVGVVALAVVLMRPQPIPVDVTPVTRGLLRVTVDEEGETRVRHRYVVAAPVTGRLERITLDEGYPVEPGSVVARLHPTPLDPRVTAEATARLGAAEAAQREADARVEQTQAALAQAERSRDRARRLRAEKLISAEEAELAELEATTRRKEHDAASFAARAAEHTAAAARAALLAAGAASPDGDTRIELRSPVQGQVLRVFEESERVVAVGTPLLAVGDATALEIVVDVLSTDAVSVRPGAAMLVEDWGGEGPLRAAVRLVEPAAFTKVSALGVEEQRVNIIADFADSPGALGDGYRVEARIVVWEGADVLKVPTSALFRSDGDWHVFVVEGSRARRRAVGIAHRNPAEVEITDGLRVGETVIVHPSDLVADGVRVAVP